MLIFLLRMLKEKCKLLTASVQGQEKFVIIYLFIHNLIFFQIVFEANLKSNEQKERKLKEVDKKVLCRLIIDSFNDENLIKKPLPFIIVLVSSGIHIKSQRPGDLSNRNYFSRFWRLEVSDQSHSDGSSLLDLQMATLSSHGFSSEQPQNERDISTPCLMESQTLQN